MADSDSWEARMAARNKERQKANAQAEIEQAKVLNVQQPWMHGWPRGSNGRDILIGTVVHCVCCGRSLGVTCVAFPPDWEPPGPEPNWPFGQEDCPLCVSLKILMNRMY